MAWTRSDSQPSCLRPTGSSSRWGGPPPWGQRRGLIALLLLLLAPLPACRYSFTGAKELPGVETVEIAYFPNSANLINPNLSPTFTEALRDIFLSQSRLSLVESGGDIQLTGSIIRYDISPINIQGSNTAAQNRLTITVRVTYENVTYPDESWEQTFSQFTDFDSDVVLSTVEQQLIEEVSERLVQDVFNKALANW